MNGLEEMFEHVPSKGFKTATVSRPVGSARRKASNVVYELIDSSIVIPSPEQVRLHFTPSRVPASATPASSEKTADAFATDETTNFARCRGTSNVRFGDVRPT